MVCISLLSGLGMFVYVIVEWSALRRRSLDLPYTETLKPNSLLALLVLLANFLELLRSLSKSKKDARLVQTSCSVIVIESKRL